MPKRKHHPVRDSSPHDIAVAHGQVVLIGEPVREIVDSLMDTGTPVAVIVEADDGALGMKVFRPPDAHMLALLEQIVAGLKIALTSPERPS